MILERTFAPPCALSCFSRYSESRRAERRCRAVMGPEPCGRGDVAVRRIPLHGARWCWPICGRRYRSSISQLHAVHRGERCAGVLRQGGNGTDVAPFPPPQRQPPGRRTATRVSRCCVRHAFAVFPASGVGRQMVSQGSKRHRTPPASSYPSPSSVSLTRWCCPSRPDATMDGGSEGSSLPGVAVRAGQTPQEAQVPGLLLTHGVDAVLIGTGRSGPPYAWCRRFFTPAELPPPRSLPVPCCCLWNG